jgi:GNAT superfamily N-acetyltransferase
MGGGTRSGVSAPEPITADHRLEDFDSGEASLDAWLQRRALRNHASGASRCFVIADRVAVIGLYTLSAGSISHEAAPRAMRRNMPDPLTVLLLGRLAIDRRHQNQGLGQALLRDAMPRAVNVAHETGVFAILLHALSDPAKRFYLSRGYVESPLQPMTLMMTLQTVQAVLAEADSPARIL